MQEIQFMRGSNLPQPSLKYIICMCVIKTSTVGMFYAAVFFLT